MCVSGGFSQSQSHICIECYAKLSKSNGCPHCRKRQFAISYCKFNLSLSIFELYQFLKTLEISQLTLLQFLVKKLLELGQKILIIGGTSSIPYVDIGFDNLSHDVDHVFDTTQLSSYDLTKIDSIITLNQAISVYKSSSHLYIWNIN